MLLLQLRRREPRRARRRCGRSLEAARPMRCSRCHWRRRCRRARCCDRGGRLRRARAPAALLVRLAASKLGRGLQRRGVRRREGRGGRSHGAGREGRSRRDWAGVSLACAVCGRCRRCLMRASSEGPRDRSQGHDWSESAVWCPPLAPPGKEADREKRSRGRPRLKRSRCLIDCLPSVLGENSEASLFTSIFFPPLSTSQTPARLCPAPSTRAPRSRIPRSAFFFLPAGKFFFYTISSEFFFRRFRSPRAARSGLDSTLSLFPSSLSLACCCCCSPPRPLLRHRR